jgi:molybdate transport system permease protein
MPVEWSPLWLSLRAAGTATAAALLPGLWLGYVLRDRPRASALAALPLGFPPVIVCAFLLSTYARRAFGWEFAAAAGIVYALPLLARAARAAFLEIEPQYAAAARTLGASEWRVFWVIALPLAWRPIFGAASLAFARLLAEFAIVLFLAGRAPAPPVAAALAAIALAAVYAGQRAAAGARRRA